jgi:membrane fusion protein (multidrug efflux system)
MRPAHVGARVASVALCLGALGGPAGAPRAQEAAASPPPSVTVLTVARREFTPSYTFTGRIEAVDSVELRARVEGFLEQRLYHEGDEVAQGAPLFTIEKAPYQSAVNEAGATLARAQAALEIADLEKRRFTRLAKEQAAAQQQADVASATAAQRSAEVQAARAALERAQLDLGYTDVVSPIAGKVGTAEYSVGSFVGPSSGALTTVVSQDPMHVTFPVSQRVLLDVRRRRLETGYSARETVVRVRLADGTLYPHAGKLDFVDVQVDPGTDTVKVRALVPNPDRFLVHDQLVTVIVARGIPEKVLVVPQPAVLVDQAGRYVLVVDEQSKVQTARITVRQGATGFYVVDEGLAEGDRVITQGIQKVRPGVVVSATEAPMPAPREAEPFPPGAVSPAPETR